MNDLETFETKSVIVEQPAHNGVRFRYECESTPSSIPGVNNSTITQTYPSVRIRDYFGNRAMIVVSCVTIEKPFKQHPNQFFDNHNCHNGVYIQLKHYSENYFEFENLCIQYSTRSQLRDRLVLRREMGIDPTNGGFDHMKWKPKDFNHNAIRLCFQVIRLNLKLLSSEKIL